MALAVVFGTWGTASADVGTDDPDPQEISERAEPATVQVITTAGGDEPETISQSGGTGIVYDADEGLIVTNAHVVQGAATVKVLIEGRAVPVRVLGMDPCEDVAVVQLNAQQDDLEELKFADSAEVERGDTVTALGYPASAAAPGSEEVSFTSGVVQDPDVTATPGSSLPNLISTIQHSATVNPGNSGGPLLNGKAEVVGINTLASNPSSGVQGQFYAISSNHAKPMLKGLAAGENKNNIGWDLLPLPELKQHYEGTDVGAKLDQVKSDGLYVLSTAPNTPASEAKLTGGDLITRIKGKPVSTMSDVCDILQSAAPGEKLFVEGLYITSMGPNNTFNEAWETNLVIPGRSR
ncbi:S1C family serine protease [Streptomyces sp. NPDC020802]|uniref:S1C family serine protease n=1 Tax=Streptomyces sp. NPDC020802 TaxID=3365094 RepID=UPI00379997CD